MQGPFGTCLWSYCWGDGEIPHESEEALFHVDDSTQGQTGSINTTKRVVGTVVHPTFRFESNAEEDIRHSLNGDGFLLYENLENRSIYLIWSK